MINVYYMKVSPLIKEDTFWSQLNIVGEERRKKTLRMANDGDRLRSLGAGILLHNALCRKLELSPDCQKPFDVSYEAGGKPFLPEFPDIHFNLSHSGDYVCCTIGNEPVGADLQKYTAVKDNFAKRFFTKKDNQMLEACSGEQRGKLFFRMWSIKESYIKFTGKGMSQGLNSFEIDWERKAIIQEEKKEPDAFYEELSFLPGYSFCVCFGNPGQEAVWQEVLWEELSRIFSN